MSQEEKEISLTIGDKINWPFILATAIMKFQESIVKEEGFQSEQEVREAALVVRNLIPKVWVDEQFEKDMKEAVIIEEIDSRNINCGVRVGNLKDHPPIKVEKINPYRLVHACVNVIERRGLISKKEWQELFPGKKWVKKDETNS